MKLGLNSLNRTPYVDNSDKMPALIQNVVKDTNSMKLDHGKKIRSLVKTIDKIHDKLRAIVAMSRTTM